MSTPTLNARPSTCPACNGPTRGNILVCESCWLKASPLDRHKFRVQYSTDPQNSRAWSAIARKIIRSVRAEAKT